MGKLMKLHSARSASGAHAAVRPRYRFLSGVLISSPLLFACASPLVAAAGDESLTWNGITFYGTYDIGVAYQSHGTPLSQDWFVGVQYLISKSSNKPITSIAPNGLSQSRLGLRGTESINEDLDFIFNAETGFDPQSGNLADAPAALTHNNGVPLERQTSAGDSARAGQLFNGQAYAGISSKAAGTLTVGRQNTVLLDNILRYDAMSGSYAFSVIGLSGTVAGGGDTEDTRLDGSGKYVIKLGDMHVAALYQPGKTGGSPGRAWQGNIGFEYAGLSVDGVYAQKKTAISVASLSAAQASTAPVNSLAATISDNESYTLGASYAAGPFKVSAGYEHIKYENPSNPLTAGFSGLGGYWIAFANNTAFPKAKVLQASWGGIKYLIAPNFDITGAIYHYDQNSYGLAHCSNTSAPTCSGSLDAYSLMADYRFSKRFDTYAGVMYSKVAGGLASGFLNDSTVSPMVGLRFRF